MVLRNAASISVEALLLSKHMAYSITDASQGSVILPPSMPEKPNSSWDILKSSPKTVVPRNARGTSNLTPSAVYKTQWPLPATVEHGVLHDSPASSLDVDGDQTSSHLQATSQSTTHLQTFRAKVKFSQPGTHQTKTMIHPKKLAQLAKKCQRMLAARTSARRRHASDTAADECCGTVSSVVADEGHCVVYTADGTRFEVPLAYLRTTVFSELLRMSEEEFGFANGRSSLKIIVPRYANGTSNRLLSVVYMTQWSLPATAIDHPSASFFAVMVWKGQC
ncbi:hypothetical protein TRIUR3_00039 [Triticum urartu]|uniref:Auxin-responsive protein SAUR36 n=1 Tax=Triticum urartu TaxID=4572 RepID=M7ZFZ4_TRIUA|nr:hypothetical protein TRIUR3_00039 [Triticum urartu]